MALHFALRSESVALVCEALTDPEPSQHQAPVWLVGNLEDAWGGAGPEQSAEAPGQVEEAGGLDHAGHTPEYALAGVVERILECE